MFQEFLCGGSLRWFKPKALVKHILQFRAAGRRGWGLYCSPNLQGETRDEEFIYLANHKGQLFTEKRKSVERKSTFFWFSSLYITTTGGSKGGNTFGDMSLQCVAPTNHSMCTGRAISCCNKLHDT